MIRQRFHTENNPFHVDVRMLDGTLSFEQILQVRTDLRGMTREQVYKLLQREKALEDQRLLRVMRSH